MIRPLSGRHTIRRVGVERETTGSILHGCCGAAGDDAGAEAVLERVYEAAGVAVGVGCREVGGVAGVEGGRADGVGGVCLCGGEERAALVQVCLGWAVLVGARGVCAGWGGKRRASWERAYLGEEDGGGVRVGARVGDVPAAVCECDAETLDQDMEISISPYQQRP